MYAEQSLLHMLDIYINPDQDLLFDNMTEKQKEIEPENLRACDTLLKELMQRGSQANFIVAESYVNVLGRVKGGMEKASQLLTEILKLDSEFIPAMLCLAVIRFIQKKQTEAKNLLKILWKKPYSSEYGEDLERAWLLYANSFI
jgi:tetratricopeptide repeat protein 21B